MEKQKMCKKTFKIQAVFNGSQNGVRHYIIKNAKFITFAKLRGTYKKGEIFNIYTESDTKYGCRWDGQSIESSIAKFEAELTEQTKE
ncbi:hypothetical protein [Bacteroides cellulosilyticus]|uniref:hypothetical protein n=1 Tax=Bacteroides cellulosilyticus TaxID=246787 RepID=UPI0022DF1659|nr:hypothetical protein [Bacteroides cellulosilyticus]